jgi:hypothetical protein
VIASLVRLKYVVVFRYEIDINCTSQSLPYILYLTSLGDDFAICVISQIELSLSIICVCFPSVKLFLNFQFPKYFGSANRPVGARGSLHLSGGESTESRSSSLLRLLRSKLSTFLGRSQASSPSNTRSGRWIDEESTPVTNVVSMPHIGGKRQPSEDLNQFNSALAIEMHDVHEKEVAP